jgi:C1A family cysteine protease
MMNNIGTGWIPDLNRSDDLHSLSPAIKPHLLKAAAPLPKAVNLQDAFPPVYDQGPTNSCTANSVAALMDYVENKLNGKFVSPSRMFIYKTTRNLLQTDNINSGAYLRTALEALVVFGAAPESYWPFKPELLPVEPPAFIYGMARKHYATKYYRYDPDGVDKAEVLQRIKANLAAGIPAAFGFFFYESITAAHVTGEIPFPAPNEKAIGGHAIVAVGFDDDKVIKSSDGSTTTGAVRIRNSWGPGWGQDGYGWLPYQYVLASLAIDWWSIFKVEWFDSGIFSVPAAESDGDNKQKSN